MKRSIVPSVPSDPTPRFSDIVTVRGAGELDKADDAAASLAFRNWLVTRGTTLGAIIDDYEEYSRYLGEYEEDRRRKIEFEGEGDIWHSLAWRWQNDRKRLVATVATALLIVVAGMLIGYGTR